MDVFFCNWNSFLLIKYSIKASITHFAWMSTRIYGHWWLVTAVVTTLAFWTASCTDERTRCSRKPPPPWHQFIPEKWLSATGHPPGASDTVWLETGWVWLTGVGGQRAGWQTEPGQDPCLLTGVSQEIQGADCPLEWPLLLKGILHPPAITLYGCPKVSCFCVLFQDIHTVNCKGEPLGTSGVISHCWQMVDLL